MKYLSDDMIVLNLLKLIKDTISKDHDKVVYLDYPSDTNRVLGMKVPPVVLDNLISICEENAGTDSTIKVEDKQFTFPEYLAFKEYTTDYDPIHKYALYYKGYSKVGDDLHN